MLRIVDGVGYKPYIGNNFSTDFGETVYGGTLNWNTGVLTVEWAVVTLTGTETWKTYGSASGLSLGILTNAIIPGYTEIPQMICSHYAEQIRSAIAEGTGVGVGIGSETHLIVNPGADYTADTFKSYLAAQYAAGTPMQVCYKLATPITIQLTPYDLKMIDSVNTIYSDGDLNYVIFNSGNSNLGKASELFLNKTSILPISNGGTGASSASGACSNIGALPTSGGAMTGFLTIKNSSSSPYIDFKTSAYNKNEGTIHYIESANETTARFYFRQYSRSSSTYEPLDSYETYYLPNTNADRTNTASYSILTTKNTISVAQGGTGKTTAADACNLFLNSLSTGSATPEDTDYYICQYAGGGTSTTTYHRRPTSALYNYIKAKTDTLYPTKTGSGASGSWSINITGSSSSCTGNASTATALTTSAGSTTLPIYFSSGKPVACAASSVFSSLSWTGGTTSGPVLSITIAGQNRAATIPSASSTASGIITTDSQTIIGKKTFATTPVISSSNSWSGLCLFNKYLSDYGIGIFQLTSVDSNNYVNGNRLVFRTYSYANNSTTRTEYYEDFKLPSVNAARTSNASYNILTTKNTIAISEGGTGATSASGALTNLGAYPKADMVFVPGGSEQTTSIVYNGKTVYRKIYSFGSVSAGSEYQIETGLGTTLDMVFNLRGTAVLADTQYVIPLPYPSSSTGLVYGLQMIGATSTPKINIKAGSGAAITSGFVILEYTKK